MICKGQGERLRYNTEDFYEKNYFREGGLSNLPPYHPASLWLLFLCNHFNVAYPQFKKTFLIILGISHWFFVPIGYGKILMFLKSHNEKLASNLLKIFI